MKRSFITIIMLIVFVSLNAQALFEIKDASDNPVFEIANDGLRVFNEGDTLMVISASEIKANIISNKDRALSRSFSVTTSTTGKAGLANVFEVTTDATTMREGVDGDKYTDFSTLNIFLGLNAGSLIGPGKYNVLIGNYAGNSTIGVDDPSFYGWSNTFLGYEAGRYATNSSHNTFVGKSSGSNCTDGNSNTFIGCYSGQNNNGGSNTFVGNSSGGNGTGLGSSNTYMGYLAGAYTSSGSSNLMLGDRAGYNIRTGNNNVSLGYRAGYQNQSGSGNICIGYEAGFDETLSNNLYIANSDTSTPLIKGTFPNTDLTFTSNKVSLVHPNGTSQGLFFQNTYNGNTDSWHLYQSISDAFQLYYNTSLRGSWDITTGIYTPIPGFKMKDIEEVENLTEKVIKLQPKKYNFTSQKAGEKKYIGLIAQDVQEIFPEFVYYHEEDNIYSIDYAGLSVVAIQAIKEQQIIIEELQMKVSEIDNLKSEIEEIKESLK